MSQNGEESDPRSTVSFLVERLLMDKSKEKGALLYSIKDICKIEEALLALQNEQVDAGASLNDDDMALRKELRQSVAALKKIPSLLRKVNRDVNPSGISSHLEGRPVEKKLISTPLIP